MKQKSWWLGYALLLTAIVALIYRRAVGLTLAQDDWVFLQRVSAVHSFGDAMHLFFQNDHFYRPVPRVLVLGLEYKLFGLRGSWFHAFNIVLHALNANLIALLVGRTTRQALSGAVAGVLYAIYPIHYLAVVWVAGLQDLLLVFGAVSCLLLYQRFVRAGGWWRYALAMLGALFALFSKDMAVVLPLWVVSLGWLEGRSWRALAGDGAFLLALVVFYLAVRSAKADIDPLNGPYKIKLDPNVWLFNLNSYATDLLGVLNRKAVLRLQPLFLGVMLLVLSGLLFWLPRDRAVMGVGLLWFGAALACVLPLDAQHYTYYLMFPLVGLMLVGPLALQRIAEAAARRWALASLRWALPSLTVALLSVYFLRQLNLSWRADMGGIRWKSLWSSTALAQFAEAYPDVPAGSTIYVRSATTLEYAAWGRSAMFKTAYPQINGVVFEGLEPAPPPDAALLDFAFNHPARPQ